MTRTHLTLLSVLALLPACALERLEAIFEAHEDTYNTGDAPDTTTDRPDTTAADTNDDTTTTTTTTTTGLDTTTTSTEPDTTPTPDSSTTAAPPICGDGQLDPNEECDDANDDPMDGCKECMRDRFIFATSVQYQGGKIDGLYGADQRCRTQAALAKLPNFATYRAWLSDSTLSAADRLQHHRGRYTLVNGLLVAMDWDDLTDGQIENPINVSEYSQPADGSRVWTGTLSSGQPAFGTSFCFDWTATATNWDLEEGGTGIRNQTDALWSYLEPGDCGSTAALYCVEQRP